MLRKGIYKHYKGNLYRVVGIATHSETLEKLVVYEPVEKPGYWVRPLEMFIENVELEGKTIPRFELIESFE
jgi:hypothetical protein